MDTIETSDAPAWAKMAEALAGVGYWRLDVATKRVQWSESMFRIFGFDPGATPSLVEAMGRVHPEDRLFADENLSRDMNGEARASTNSVRVLWPSGELRYIEGRTTNLKAADGDVIAIVGAIIDVTERKHIEFELLRAKESAERAMRARTAFVANVTHELRTPLTSIIGYANLLGDGNSEDKRRLNLLRGASQTLLSMVNNLLDYSRIEEGHPTITRVASSPRSLGQECLDLLRGLAEERGLGLRYTPAPDLPSLILIDADAVRQILVNLIGNAVKFTRRGWVSLSMEYNDGSLYLTVEDSGTGLDPVEIDGLFERYAQAGAHQDRQDGAGLGLAICKGLVEAMGGVIRASNGVAGGARFTCELPASLAAGLSDINAPTGLGNARVLIADDNASIREIAKCILSAAGANVSEASDGLSAVALASTEIFDVLFIDLNMPGISGSEVIKYLRSLGLNRAATIIAFTANGGITLAEARAQGFDDLFRKPIDPAKLIYLVHTAAQLKRAA